MIKFIYSIVCTFSYLIGKMKNNISYNEIIENICELVQKHNQQEKSLISLIASTNVVSKRVLEVMNSDLLNRAAEGKNGSSFLPGLDYFYEIDRIGNDIVKDVFSAEFADLRPISGSQANHIIYQALTQIGDTILLPSIRSGAHISMAGKITKEFRNYNFVHTKNVEGSLLIDIDDAIDKINEYRPRILFLGGSVILEWQDISLLIDAVHAINGVVVFDASQVAGLIATGCFTNPLDCDVDIITMTTCKTLPGPSHAWILGKEKYRESIEKTIFPGYISGGHLQEHVGAIVALLEILQYGNGYGKAIIEHSRLLAGILEEGGFKFLQTCDGQYTDTQQLIAYEHNYFDISEIESKLEQINILLNKNLLPPNGLPMYGVRLGCQEITRQGATKEQIIKIGMLINEYLQDNLPQLDAYRKKVRTIKESFGGYKFI